MKLKLSNNVTKVVTILENIVDLAGSAYNYEFDVELPAGMDDGEYEYVLMDDENNPLATGVAQIGTYEPEKTAYTAQTKNTYVQYQG